MYVEIFFLWFILQCRLSGLKLPLGWQCGEQNLISFSWGGLASLSTHNKDAIWQSVNMTAICKVPLTKSRGEPFKVQTKIKNSNFCHFY